MTLARRVGLCVAVALMIPVALSAGGTGEQTVEEPIVIRVSWWGSESRHNAMLETFEAYQRVDPTVRLEGQYSGWGGYYEKLVVQLAGGTAPDLMWMHYPWFSELAEKGDFFIDFYNQDVMDISGWDTNVLAAAELGDTLPGLPCSINTEAIFFNTKLLEKVDVDLTSDTKWTWEDLISEGEQFAAKYPDLVFFHTEITTTDILIFQTMVRQICGNQFIDESGKPGFVQEDLEKAFGLIQRMYQNGVFQPIEQSSPFDGMIEQNPAWVQGKALLTLRWISDIPKLTSENVELDSALCPLMGEKNGYGIKNQISPRWAVSSASTNIDKTLSYLSFIMNEEEGAKILGPELGIPANGNRLSVLNAAGMLPPLYGETLNRSNQYPSLPLSPNSGNTEVASLTQDTIQQVAYGIVTPSEAAAEYMAEVKQILGIQ